jgi:hypothetical protein
MKSTERVKYERINPIKVNEEWIKVTTGHRIRKDGPKRIKGSRNAQRRGGTGKATECICLASGMVVLSPIVVVSMLVGRMVVMWSLWHLELFGLLFPFEPDSDLYLSPTHGIYALKVIRIKDLLILLEDHANMGMNVLVRSRAVVYFRCLL